MSDTTYRSIPAPLRGLDTIIDEVETVVEDVSKTITTENGVPVINMGNIEDGKQWKFTTAQRNFDWILPSNSQEPIDIYDANGNLIQNEIPVVAGFRYRNGSSGCNSFTTQQVATWQTYASGKCSLAIGANNKSMANYSATLGCHNINKGPGSFVAGTTNIVTGNYSAILGRNGAVSGDSSLAVSDATMAPEAAKAMMAEALGVETYEYPKISDASIDAQKNNIDNLYANWGGKFSVATGNHSFVGGINSVAAGNGSIAFGRRTFAAGQYSIAFGQDTLADGHFSVALSDGTKAIGDSSISAGYKTTANGNQSVALGEETNATGINAIAVGIGTIASGGQSFAGGSNSTSSGFSSFAFGCDHSVKNSDDTITNTPIIASGRGSVAFGEGTSATEEASIAFGIKTKATGTGSVAFGLDTIASGVYSLVNGNGSVASGKYSFALGYNNTASGESSIATGTTSVAKGRDSVAIGYSSKSFSPRTVAMGYAATAGAENDTDNHSCISLGNYTVAKGVLGQVAIGSGNQHISNAQLMVGIGTNSTRKNGFVVYTDGHAEVESQGTTDKSVVINSTLKNYATTTYVDNALSSYSPTLPDMNAANVDYDGAEKPLSSTNVSDALDAAGDWILSISGDLSSKAPYDHTHNASEIHFANSSIEVFDVSSALEYLINNMNTSNSSNVEYTTVSDTLHSGNVWNVLKVNGEIVQASKQIDIQDINNALALADEGTMLACEFPIPEDLDGLFTINVTCGTLGLEATTEEEYAYGAFGETILHGLSVLSARAIPLSGQVVFDCNTGVAVTEGKTVDLATLNGTFSVLLTK